MEGGGREEGEEGGVGEKRERKMVGEKRERKTEEDVFTQYVVQRMMDLQEIFTDMMTFLLVLGLNIEMKSGHWRILTWLTSPYSLLLILMVLCLVSSLARSFSGPWKASSPAV